MRFDEYRRYDALGLKALLDAGEISAQELHGVARSAIDTLNPALNFLVSESPEEAERALQSQQAQQAQQAEAPFAGIPFLVKEGVGMTGQPFSLGCRLGKGLTWAVPPPPNRYSMVLPAIPGIRTIALAAQVAAPPLPWPQGWCRWRKAVMAAGRFAHRPIDVESSV